MPSVRMLTALGVWEGLGAIAQPIHEILVTDGAAGKPASPFSLHFDAGEIGADALGHIAENRHIRAALYEAVARAPNLKLDRARFRQIAGGGIRARRRHPGGWRTDQALRW